jgi:hypothetical protein
MGSSCNSKLRLNDNFLIDINLSDDGIEMKLIELASNRKDYDTKSKAVIDSIFKSYVEKQKVITTPPNSIV